MRWVLLSLVLLGVGCSSPPPDTTLEQREREPDFSSPQALAEVLTILDQLPRADEPPATERLSIVLTAGPSPQVSDGVRLTLWHDAEHGEVWLEQAGGYPGVDIWFGPGPDTLLPSRVRPRQLVTTSSW